MGIYHNYSGTYSTILLCMGTILWNLKLGDVVGKIPFILCIVRTYIRPGFFFCLSHFSRIKTLGTRLKNNCMAP